MYRIFIFKALCALLWARAAIKSVLFKFRILGSRLSHTVMNLDTGKLGKHRCLSHVLQTLALYEGEIDL